MSSEIKVATKEPEPPKEMDSEHLTVTIDVTVNGFRHGRAIFLTREVFGNISKDDMDRIIGEQVRRVANESGYV